MMLQRVKLLRISSIIVIILAVGHSSDQDRYACSSTEIKNDFLRLHFNTTILSGVSGNCSCKFYFPKNFFMKIDTMKFMIQNCTDGYPAFTVITSQTFTFTCNNNKIETRALQELSEMELKAADEFWILVSKTKYSPVFSGSIAIQSMYGGGDFSVTCYEPNKNIPSALTTEKTKSTSTISMTFSTSPMRTSSTTSSTNPSISTSATPITLARTTSSSYAITTTAIIPETTFLTSRERNENSSNSAPLQITSTKESRVSPENQLGNQVPVPEIAGGAAGAVAVLLIIVIVLGIACYRKKKSSPSTENNTDPNVQELNRINAVHDNNQPDGQDLDQNASVQSNTDQSKAFDSVREDPEGSFTENTLYESSAKSQFSGSSKPSDFTLEHETASSGDVYAVVWKSGKGN